MNILLASTIILKTVQMHIQTMEVFIFSLVGQIIDTHWSEDFQSQYKVTGTKQKKVLLLLNGGP
jgi:hypothetical protein